MACGGEDCRQHCLILGCRFFLSEYFATHVQHHRKVEIKTAEPSQLCSSTLFLNFFSLHRHSTPQPPQAIVSIVTEDGAGLDAAAMKGLGLRLCSEKKVHVPPGRVLGVEQKDPLPPLPPQDQRVHAFCDLLTPLPFGDPVPSNPEAYNTFAFELPVEKLASAGSYFLQAEYEETRPSLAAVGWDDGEDGATAAPAPPSLMSSSPVRLYVFPSRLESLKLSDGRGIVDPRRSLTASNQPGQRELLTLAEVRPEDAWGNVVIVDTGFTVRGTFWCLEHCRRPRRAARLIEAML